MEGDVVMVRLGADEGEMEANEAEEQGSSYVELKPSTTLLVPLELMEGQDSLVDTSQLALPGLHQTIVPDDPMSESHSSFSLMLDVDEEADKNAEMPLIPNDLQFSDPPILSPAMEPCDENLAKSEVILLDTDDQVALLSGETFEEEQRNDMDVLGGLHVDGELVNPADQFDLQAQTTEANHESEDVIKQVDAELEMLAEDQEPAGLLVSGPSPVRDLLAVVAYSMAETNAVEEETGVEEDRATTAENLEEPEENGPVNTEAEIACSTEMETAVEEKPQDNKVSAETEEENHEAIKTETETKRSEKEEEEKHQDVEEEKAGSDHQVEDQPLPEAPSSQRKKKAPSTPTRRTTRAKAVSFISPLPEEAEEPKEGEKIVEAETSIVVPASPSRTPRKTKQNKEINVQATPRRSARRAQQEQQKEEAGELVEAKDHDATVASTSKASSPARRVSQRTTSRSSRSSSQEVSTAAEVESKEDEVTDTKSSRRTTSKTSTPAKRRTTQASTPRRSRRILSSSEVVPTVLEEKEEEEVFASPARRNSRRTNTEPSEEQEEEKKQPVSSPSRNTRQSNQNTLNIYPQVRIEKCRTVNKLCLISCKLSNTKLHVASGWFCGFLFKYLKHSLTSPYHFQFHSLHPLCIVVFHITY